MRALVGCRYPMTSMTSYPPILLDGKDSRLSAIFSYLLTLQCLHML